MAATVAPRTEALPLDAQVLWLVTRMVVATAVVVVDSIIVVVVVYGHHRLDLHHESILVIVHLRVLLVLDLLQVEGRIGGGHRGSVAGRGGGGHGGGGRGGGGGAGHAQGCGGGRNGRLTDHAARPTAGGRFAQLLGAALDGPITAEQDRALAEHLSGGGEVRGVASVLLSTLLAQLPEIAGQALQMLPFGGGRYGPVVVVGRRRLGCTATAHNGGGGLGWLLLQYIGGCVTCNQL